MRTLLRFLLIFAVVFLLFRYVFAILFPHRRVQQTGGKGRHKKSSIPDDRIQDAHFQDLPKE